MLFESIEVLKYLVFYGFPQVRRSLIRKASHILAFPNPSGLPSRQQCNRGCLSSLSASHKQNVRIITATSSLSWRPRQECRYTWNHLCNRRVRANCSAGVFALKQRRNITFPARHPSALPGNEIHQSTELATLGIPQGRASKIGSI